MGYYEIKNNKVYVKMNKQYLSYISNNSIQYFFVVIPNRVRTIHIIVTDNGDCNTDKQTLSIRDSNWIPSSNSHLI